MSDTMSLAPLCAEKTALVVVDMQQGLPFDYKPYSYSQVGENAGKLAAAFQKANAYCVFLKVASQDGKDGLCPVTDLSLAKNLQPKTNFERKDSYDHLIPELECIENAHIITKHQWGSFYGTELDLQLRRREIDTIVLCGVATGFGVDTTAREAYQLGYQQIFAQDAMGALSQQEHDYVCGHIFPFMGRVRSTQEILDAGFQK